MLDFRTLKAEEIECRVGQINEDGFTLLLYKDARCDMNLLDEVCGKENWQREHKEIKGNIYCGVSIYDYEKMSWVTKWDCGTESCTEKEKGESSDSFKRACVNWGIGRELYSAPLIKIKGHVKKNSKGKLVPAFWRIEVTEISYNEKREIGHLIIKGDNDIIFEYGKKSKTPTQENLPFPEQGVNAPRKSKDELKAERQVELMKLGAEFYPETTSVGWQNVLVAISKDLGKKFSELTEKEYSEVLENIKARKY